MGIKKKVVIKKEEQGNEIGYKLDDSKTKVIKGVSYKDCKIKINIENEEVLLGSQIVFEDCEFINCNIEIKLLGSSNIDAIYGGIESLSKLIESGNYEESDRENYEILDGYALKVRIINSVINGVTISGEVYKITYDGCYINKLNITGTVLGGVDILQSEVDNLNVDESNVYKLGCYDSTIDAINIANSTIGGLTIYGSLLNYINHDKVNILDVRINASNIFIYNINDVKIMYNQDIIASTVIEIHYGLTEINTQMVINTRVQYMNILGGTKINKSIYEGTSIESVDESRVKILGILKEYGKSKEYVLIDSEYISYNGEVYSKNGFLNYINKQYEIMEISEKDYIVTNMILNTVCG